MSSKLAFQSLSGSEEFKYVLSGKKLGTPLFTIYYKEKKNDDKVNSIMLSCVAAKKLGSAVKRNKMRRRLKMATRKAITEIKKSFQIRFKYAIFAKPKIYDEKFQNIVDQLVIKFKSI